jgi:hydroxymethylbilane synthase
MTLGTRGSPLALWQAHAVARRIESAGGPGCAVVVIRTSGDDRAEADGGRGAESVKRLFVKELEEALLDGRIDVAVHSSKDLPTDLPKGLTIGATLPRDDPRDALVLAGKVGNLEDLEAAQTALGPSPRIGTSSIRREAQLRSAFPGATFLPVRGNVDTRIRKLDAGECDVLVLAAAGLRRLGYDERISCTIPADRCTPAPGQGIIAVEVRSERVDISATLDSIGDPASAVALEAERAVVRALGGGCQLPIGAFAEVTADDVCVTGAVITPDGSRVVRQSARGSRTSASALGERVGHALLTAGAGAILDAVRRHSRPGPPAAAP